MIEKIKAWLLRMLLGERVTRLVLCLQEARAYSDYMIGGINADTVVSEHILDHGEALAAMQAKLDEALDLLGAES